MDEVDLLVHARAALLDALDALESHLNSVVIIGAQAIYLRTAGAPVAVAEATKDSDLALDPRTLDNDPLLEAAMKAGGFSRNLTTNQPGAWLSSNGIPVDLMVPEGLAGSGGKSARGARIPPHDRHAARRASGLEATVIDNEIMTVTALDPADHRTREVRVAGTAALVVAKAHKIGERASNTPNRLIDKDAHDLYRILVATDTQTLATDITRLLGEELSRGSTIAALDFIHELFARGPESLGSQMAGRAEEGLGNPVTVALQTSILASDLLEALGH
ncbi:MAG TPA: hypothetical protein VL068_05235 [Microthrixaceae bacterium]|nr:hypothetical protein [Microthrixaceae bacterium]